MSMENIDWSNLYQHRKKISRQFGSVWKLPVEKRYHSVLKVLGKSGCKVLEIGAGDKKLRHRLKREWGNLQYFSCDLDSQFDHDFKSIAAIEGEYDLICAFELVEHLTLDDASAMLKKCFAHMSAGGKLMLTTPNIYYPPAYLRDATHITPFCYDELGGLVEKSGFTVTKICRLYHDALIKKLVKRILLYPLFRVMNIDFAKQIAVVAIKDV